MMAEMFTFCVWLCSSGLGRAGHGVGARQRVAELVGVRANGNG